MALRLLLASVAFGYTLVSATPLSEAATSLKARQAAVSPVPAATIASYRPYAFYAAAAYCTPANTLAWNCGFNCQSNPSFTPVASGGNGATEQYWYVGYDSTLGSIIVGRQGTDSSKIIPVITNANFFPDDLDATLFPGVPSNVRAHDGFTDSHARSSKKILAAVNTAISRFATSNIAVVGHSLGGALALLDGISLAATLPGATVSITTFGAPRVGNQEFVNYVSSKFAGRVSRIVNRDDIVPILPGRFLGFAHVQGEKRIQEDGSWMDCPGQDNTDNRCTVGAVRNIFEGNVDDHSGPYTGTGVVDMGC